ncbi:MAG: NAD-dependent epimerase/dehydratase family protein [Polyangiales bacterium]
MIDYPSLLAHSETAVLRDPKDLGRCLVTGAAGFLGRNLVKGLLAQGCEVRAVVHRAPLALRDAKLELVSASVTDREAMREACSGVSTVFHSAAKIALLGGPSAADRYYGSAYETNVVGTRNLLAAARAAGAKRFVHTSSVDVCFDYGHQPAMTEAAPYSRSRRSVYQQTKILAEQSVLEANGLDGLATCAVRPGGIYGPEKNVMLDRFVEQLVRGLLLVRIGDGTSRWDVSEVSNLVHGEILAALHLGHREDGTPGIANGQAYFVTDGEPVNAFEFFRPIVEALGHRLPDRWIPGEAVLPFLLAMERVVLALGLDEPELSPHAVRKLVHTHWGSIAKARRELGYVPPKTVPMAVAECIPYCRKLAASLRARHA